MSQLSLKRRPSAAPESPTTTLATATESNAVATATASATATESSPPEPLVTATVPTQPIPEPAATPAAPAPYRYKRPTRQKGSLFGLSTLVFIAVCAFSYYKYDEYKNQPPPPPKPKPAQPLKEVPLNANPLTALKQAKDVIQTANDKLKSSYDEVAAMDQTTAPTGTAPKPGQAPAMPATAGAATPAANAAPANQGEAPAVRPQDNSLVTTAATANLPPPGPAFVKWGRKIRIGGIRAGSTVRVFIDRTTYQKGDLVDPTLGIRFENYDPATRVLRFVDRTGAVMEIQYGAD